MNAGLSKVHFVNTTGVSLNDRFTTMTKSHVGFGMAPAVVEAPFRPRTNSITRASDSNRRLIDQWDRLHDLHALTANVVAPAIVRPVRQRLQRNALAQQVKRTMDKLAGGVRRLQRSNSFTDIATMNADRMELLQRVRERTPTISSRLGDVRAVTRGRSMSRGRSVSRTRSNSRGRQPSLTRANSQTNLRRAGSRTNLVRVGSRTNLTRAGSRNGLNLIAKPIAPNDARRRIHRNNLLANRLGTVNGAAAAVTRGRSRSRSRIRGAAAANVAAVAANGRARSRSRNRAGSRARAGSVNSRLGANRTNAPAANAGGRANGGRVTKRSRSRVNATVLGTRTGRPLKREPPKRKGAGGKAAAKVAARSNGGAGGATAAAAGRRGRSRSRRDNSRVRGRSASKNRTGNVKKQPKSREELDSELDQYMANTKSSMDKEMDQYMNGIGH
uniref:FoP_duplication domain-containing protein n=1 Tax=Anopheles epiroticus TaxID=199890 RepID=A0A182P2C6_9DIPT